MEKVRCRLCAEENTNNYQLDNELINKINCNLPVKVYKGTICVGCHLQLESTIEFFDLIRNGQVILEDIESKCFPKENFSQDFVPSAEIVEILYTPSSSPGIDNISNQSDITQNISTNNSNLRINNTENSTNNNFNIIKSNLNKISYSNKGREIKKPIRYKSNQFEGDELKKMYADFGITDDMDFVDLEMENTIDSNEKLICYIENKNGLNIGDIVKIPPNTYKEPNKRTKKYQKTHFICDVCKIRLPNELTLLEHRLTHKNVLYECTQCQETFDIRDKLFHHQTELSHNGQGIIENFIDLTQQKQEYLDSKNLIEKQTINNSDIYTCKECDIEFESITECENHFTLTHGDKYKYYCSICHKCFKCKLNVERHHKIVHDNIRPYTCRYCGMNFATKLNANNHEKSHMHENIERKTLTCTLCNTFFDYNSSFKRHMEQHVNKRQFSCAICLKVFRQKVHLLEHERVHTGIKPFECDQCGDRFVTYSQRRAHKIRVHSLNVVKKNIKFVCLICGKNASSKEALRKHNRIHTGEKPYKCDCGRNFSDPSNLRKHLLQHKNNKTNIELENKNTNYNNLDEIVQNIFGNDINDNNLVEEIIGNSESNIIERIIENNEINLAEPNIENIEVNLVEQLENNEINIVGQILENNESNLVQHILNNNENILVDQIFENNENNLCERIIKNCENNEIMNKLIYINPECNLVCDNASFLDGNFGYNLNFL